MHLKVGHVAALVLAVFTCLLSASATELYDLQIPLGIPAPKIPKDNPLTKDKVELGRKLFFDERFAYNSKLSCAGCHMPEHGFANFLPIGFTSTGAALHRNTPTSVNAALQDYQFWDGRASSLEEQVIEVYHLTADSSIGIELPVKICRESPNYAAAFQKVFGEAPNANNFSQAISAYERSTLSGDTRFDRFMFKHERDALTLQEKQGLGIFMGKGNCSVCHTIMLKSESGDLCATFMDQKFHNLGVGAYGKRMKDAGRYDVTGDPKDFGLFKTPNLRNVELTSPYMHDGSLATLEAVTEFYDKGGKPNPNLDKEIKPLYLTPEEKKSLVAFLKTLTDEKLAKLYVPVPELQEKLRKELENE